MGTGTGLTSLPQRYFAAEPLLQFRFVPGFTLPDGDDFPAESLQLAVLPPVAGHIFRKLGFPERLVAFGGIGKAATQVPVPIAAVNQNHGAASRQNNVGTPRQVFAVQPESVAHPMQQRTNQSLRTGIRAADAGHIPTAALSGYFVHSSSPDAVSANRPPAPQSGMTAAAARRFLPAHTGRSGCPRRNSYQGKSATWPPRER